MSDYKGVIIEESLIDPFILKDLEILNTDVEEVVGEHQTPWLAQWTLHTVEIPEEFIDLFVERLSLLLEEEHPWYCDFRNHNYHYIVYREKVFKVDRKKPEDYNSAIEYGLTKGIPEYQLDFSPDIDEDF